MLLIRFSVYFPYGISSLNRIDTKRGRDSLPSRREPYWYKLSKGRYLGLRKLPGGHASWIARIREEEGRGQSYKALGEIWDGFEFDQAKIAAENWFREVERGVSGRNDDGTKALVRDACIGYIRALRREGRMEAAQDAHMRFRRTVYGNTADSELQPESAVGRCPAKAVKHRRVSKKLEAHAIASIELRKIRGAGLRKWHLDLAANGLSKASANRTLTALKAALNLAVRDRRVSADVAQEWAEVVPLKGDGRRTDKRVAINI